MFPAMDKRDKSKKVTAIILLNNSQEMQAENIHYKRSYLKGQSQKSPRKMRGLQIMFKYVISYLIPYLYLYLSYNSFCLLSRLTCLPCINAAETLLLFISSISPSQITMLASLPTSREPVLLSTPRIFAAFNVIACNACSLVKP